MAEVMTPSCHLCDEDAVYVCTNCHDFYCRDHMEGYICVECDGDLWGEEE